MVVPPSRIRTTQQKQLPSSRELHLCACEAQVVIISCSVCEYNLHSSATHVTEFFVRKKMSSLAVYCFPVLVQWLIDPNALYWGDEAPKS